MGLKLDQAAALRAEHDITAALRSLHNQALMGESSYNGLSFGALMEGTGSGIILTQASLRDDNRYQALAAHSAQGKTLADYQQQRVEQRRESVDQYLNAFYALARDYAREVDPAYNGDFSAHRTNLSQLIEDPDSGAPLSGKDHRIADNAIDREQALAFMERHDYELRRVRQLYRALKEAPTSLEGWLQQHNIDLNAAMDKALDDTRYSGASAGDNRLDVLTSHTRVVGATAPVGLHTEDDTLQLGSHQPMSSANQQDLKLAHRLDKQASSIKIADGAAGHYQLYLNESLPEQIQRRDQRIADMQSIQRALGTQVEQRFKLQHNTEHFSLQDMVSNLVAGRPVAALKDGSAHPQAAAITQFYQQHQASIDRYQQLARQHETAQLRGGMQILGTHARYSPERIEENIAARLNTESKTQILASIDDPRLQQAVQHYFDRAGERTMGGAHTPAAAPDIARAAAHASSPPNRLHQRNSTLFDSIQDPLLKLALRNFTHSAGHRSDT